MSGDEAPALIIGDGPVDELDVSFHGCEWGWIHVGIAPLDHGWCARCTHLASPFGDMLRWLEEIADGADCAAWTVCEEGCAMRFVFLGAPRSWWAEGAPMLLLARCRYGVSRMAAWAVEPDVLIRAFYGGFRRFTESAEYRPDHWEWSGVREADIPDDTPDDEVDRLLRWSGERLRELRSTKLDALMS